MTVRVEAGRLTHVDLGKTIEIGGTTGVTAGVTHMASCTYIWFSNHPHDAIALDPHTLVTITGKDTHDG